MKDNGSPAVKFEFDEERTWFMVTVPVHEWFLEGDDTVNDTVNDTVKLAAEVAGFFLCPPTPAADVIVHQLRGASSPMRSPRS